MRIVSLCNFVVIFLLSGVCIGCGSHNPQVAGRSDWIELTSGEWVKGRIRSMQQWELDIDSDKLNDLNIDWDDVKQLYMLQGSVLYGNAQTATGRIHIDQNTITVDGPNPLQIPRSELLSISPGGTRERDYWSGSVDLGVTLRRGNTNETEVTAQAQAQRRTTDSRFEFSFESNYDATSGAQTTDNDRVKTSFDLLISPKVFIRPINGEYFRDVPLNLEHQATVSAGAGYLIFDQPKLEWDLYAGPAYQYTKFVQTEAGTAGEAKTVAAVFQTNFKKKKVTRYIDVFVDWQGILTSREAGLFTEQLDATVRFEITHLMHLDFTFTWNRTEQPKPDSSGKTPKRDDIQTVLSLGVQF